MNNCYCKNCNNLSGEWNNEHECYYGLYYCEIIQSKNNESIYFLDCKNCNKFIGIYCWKVCERCFGKKKYLKKKIYLIGF